MHTTKKLVLITNIQLLLARLTLLHVKIVFFLLLLIEYRSIFNKADKNKDGYLTEQEMTAVLEEYGKSVHERLTKGNVHLL